MTPSLDGQTLVVIGASSGIGHAVAAAALAAGATVHGFSRSGCAPSGVTGHAVDVADEAALAHAYEMLGPIDHLVFTAWGGQGATPLPALQTAALAQSFGIKLFAAVQAIRLALPQLAPTASVTLTSGQVSRKYGSGSLLKGTVNAAIDAAGKHLAKELAPRRVNVVSPGITDTPQWGKAGSDKRTGFLTRAAAALPVGRVATPENLAAAYLFLLTNPFVTGAVIDVDGGALL